MKEIDVFHKYCPVPQSEVEQISHRVLMQIFPGFLSANLDFFAQGLWAINGLGFKNVEINLQPQSLWDLMIILYENYDYPIGMSSFGPTIFMICDSESQARDIQEELSKKFTTDPRFLGCRISLTLPNNIGHHIENL